MLEQFQRFQRNQAMERSDMFSDHRTLAIRPGKIYREALQYQAQ